jgi:predicted kinase
MTPTFLMLIGIPASGKTAYRKTLSNFKAVCPDEIRRKIFHVVFDQSVEPEVWKVTELQVSHHLRNRRNVVLDATNLISFYRRPFLRMANKFGAQIKAVIFNTPLEVCLKRNKERKEDTDEKVVKMMHRQFQDLMKDPSQLYEEGFDDIIIYRYENGKINEKRILKI